MFAKLFLNIFNDTKKKNIIITGLILGIKTVNGKIYSDAQPLCNDG